MKEEKLIKILGAIFSLIGFLLFVLSFFVTEGRAILFILGVVFGGIGGGLVCIPLWKRRQAARLMREGHRLEAEFRDVVLNENFSVNDRHPYRMRVQYRDPVTQIISTFESGNIWLDPTEYMQGKTVSVYVDKGDASKYYVDTAGLLKND